MMKYTKERSLARLAAFAGGRRLRREAGGAAAALEGCAGFECLRAYVAAPDPHCVAGHRPPPFRDRSGVKA